MGYKRQRLLEVAAEVWGVREGPGRGDIYMKNIPGRGNSCPKGPKAETSSLGGNPKKACELSGQEGMRFRAMRQGRWTWANCVETYKARLQVLKLNFIPRAMNMNQQSGLTCLVYGASIKGRASVEAGLLVRNLVWWPMRGGGEQETDSKCVLKEDSIGFAYGLDVRYKGTKGVRSKCFPFAPTLQRGFLHTIPLSHNPERAGYPPFHTRTLRGGGWHCWPRVTQPPRHAFEFRDCDSGFSMTVALLQYFMFLIKEKTK